MLKHLPPTISSFRQRTSYYYVISNGQTRSYTSFPNSLALSAHTVKKTIFPIWSYICFLSILPHYINRFSKRRTLDWNKLTKFMWFQLIVCLLATAIEQVQKEAEKNKVGSENCRGFMTGSSQPFTVGRKRDAKFMRKKPWVTFPLKYWLKDEFWKP